VEASDRRREARARLAAGAAVAPDDVIMGPDAARRAGLTSTVVFPVGNLAPEGAGDQSTALDPPSWETIRSIATEGPRASSSTSATRFGP